MSSDISLPISRANAKMQGSRKYFTGKPCKNGHLVFRWTSGASCSACMIEHCQSEHGKEINRKYRNTDEFKAKDRARNQNRSRIEYDRKRSKTEFRKDQQKFRRFKIKYGISFDQFYDLFISQFGKCKICGVFFNEESHKPNSPSIDHCHITGKVRGLLCTNCNHGLGKFKDNPQFLSKAISYLTDFG